MEKQVIQSVGFRNIKDENGNVTGFDSETPKTRTAMSPAFSSK